jgi:hypothetical protein
MDFIRPRKTTRQLILNQSVCREGPLVPLSKTYKELTRRATSRLSSSLFLLKPNFDRLAFLPLDVYGVPNRAWMDGDRARWLQNE